MNQRTEPDFDRDLSIDRLFDEYANDPEHERRYREAQTSLELSEYMKALRKRKGLSQAELAERVGRTQPLVAKLEAGGYDRMGFSGVRTFALALGMDLVAIENMFRDAVPTFSGSSPDAPADLDDDGFERSAWDVGVGHLRLLREGDVAA